MKEECQGLANERLVFIGGIRIMVGLIGDIKVVVGLKGGIKACTQLMC